MFATKIAPTVLKGMKHLSMDAETPISDLKVEAIR